MTNENVNLILEDFLKRTNIISEKEYSLVLKTIYIKILNEINFVDNYLIFSKLLFSIYYKKSGYTPQYFFNLIEKKINYDYFNKSNDENLFYEKYNIENYRINNLILTL